jgi:tetratricopeptide (TPR) repeat protein
MHTPEQKNEPRRFPVRLLLAAAAGGILLALLPADTVEGALPLAPVCAADPQPAGAAGAQWFPRDPQFALQAARELLARPDYSAALCYLESVRPLIAGDPSGLAALGDAYWGGGRATEAVRAWEQARAAGNDGDPVLRSLTVGYVQEEQWDSAAPLLAEWLARHPEDGAAALRLSLIRAAEEPESALESLSALAEKSGPEAEQADGLANIIRAAAALDDPAYLHARTGEELIRLGEPALAEIALRKALALNPEYGEAYALLGLAQESAGEDPGIAYRQSAQSDPDSVIVCLLYGSWLERTGDLAEARDWLTRAWEKKPGCVIYYEGEIRDRTEGSRR